MKSYFFSKYTFWIAVSIILTPIVITQLNSNQTTNWHPSNHYLQSIYDGCKNLENLSFILKTLVEGTHFDPSLKKAGSSLFGAILNTSNLGAQTIQILEKDVPTLKNYYECVIQSDAILRGHANNKTTTSICPSISCISKQSCIGATIAETAHFLTPLIHSLLGKIIDENQTSSQESYRIESGLLSNIQTLAIESLATAKKTGLTKTLGSSGEKLIETIQKNLVRLETLTNSLAVASNDILFALQVAAPLLGGSDYIASLPELTPKEREELLSQEITFDPNELDELTLEDFLI